MNIIFQSLVKQLQDAVASKQGIWIDMESGQLDAMEENYPVTFPAIFIDFAGIDYSNLSQGVQLGVASINFRVAIDTYSGFHGSSPDLDAAAGSLELLTSIHQALHGYSGCKLTNSANEIIDNYFSRLQRVSISTEKRNDGLKVFNIVYETTITDTSAMPQTTLATISMLDILATRE